MHAPHARAHHAEHLCARRGYTVLNDDVIRDAKILILLAGEPSASFPLGRAIAHHSLDRIDSDPTVILPAIPLVTQIRNLDRIVPVSTPGVWLLSTEALWSLADEQKPINDLSSSSLSAFCCRVPAAAAASHGSYELHDDESIRSLAYRKPPADGQDTLMILGLLYLPPTVASNVLSLASTYPLSRATYHGLDSGAIGLRLSLFFDFVYSTCSGLEEFVGCRIAPEKIDCEHVELLELARRVIHARLGKYRTMAVILDTLDVQYLDTLATLETFEWSSFTASVLSQLQSALTTSILPIVQFLRSALASREPSCLQELLKGLSEVSSTPSIDTAVLLTTVSAALWEWAGGRGGLRGGPAANVHFARHFALLEQRDSTPEGVKNLIAALYEGNWLATPQAIVRAARHFEAAAQVCTRRRVMEACSKHLHPRTICARANNASSGADSLPTRVRVALPARIDLFGGWLDTPPITLDTVAGVLNAAVLIDGERPLACSVVRSPLPSYSIGLEDGSMMTLSEHEVWQRHDKPAMQGALVCACLVACGFVTRDRAGDKRDDVKNASGGLEIRLESLLAHGSGLGSSSILAAACILALWEMSGEERDDERLVHVVLYVEQLLTTGGGWQDQVGGVYPGLKLARFCPERQTVVVQPITVSPSLEHAINDRLVIVYTGQPRLAKNLLQEVVRSWLTREGDKCAALREMSGDVERAEEWINSDALPLSHIAQYYSIKKRLATGCEPEGVTRIIEALSSVSSTCWLVGAGGGGYLCVALREEYGSEQAQFAIDRAGLANLRVQRVQLCHESVNVERQID